MARGDSSLPSQPRPPGRPPVRRGRPQEGRAHSRGGRQACAPEGEASAACEQRLRCVPAPAGGRVGGGGRGCARIHGPACRELSSTPCPLGDSPALRHLSAHAASPPGGSLPTGLSVSFCSLRLLPPRRRSRHTCGARCGPAPTGCCRSGRAPGTEGSPWARKPLAAATCPGSDAAARGRKRGDSPWVSVRRVAWGPCGAACRPPSPRSGAEPSRRVQAAPLGGLVASVLARALRFSAGPLARVLEQQRGFWA